MSKFREALIRFLAAGRPVIMNVRPGSVSIN